MVEHEYDAQRFWVLVNNPAKWEIDKFLRSGKKADSWALSPHKSPPRKGDLAFIRVGNDRRSKKVLGGYAPLDPGIYALCEITSDQRIGTGVSGEFWRGGNIRPHETGEEYPTVDFQVLKSYLSEPLLLPRIQAEFPTVKRRVLAQPEARSYDLPRDDFMRLLEMLGTSEEELPELVEMAPVDLGAVTPQRILLQQHRWERGAEGRRAKIQAGHECLLCRAMGRPSIAFHRPDGVPYVEAHHVIPVSKGTAGTLSPKNIVTVCANHHRQLHYGGIAEPKDCGDSFTFAFPGGPISVPKLKID